MRRLLIWSSDHLAGEGYVTDLSMGGLRVTINGPVAIGTRFWVHICNRPACPALMTYYHLAVEIELAVTRWSTPQEMGLQIYDMTWTHEQRLRHLMGNSTLHNGDATWE